MDTIEERVEMLLQVIRGREVDMDYKKQKIGRTVTEGIDMMIPEL